MNIEDLLPDSGKLTAIHAAKVVMQKPELITLLFDLAFIDKKQFSMRAANVIQIIDSIDDSLIRPFYPNIIRGFEEFRIDGVKRCFLKLISNHVDIPSEDLLGILVNYCFSKASSSDPVAIKVYSILILYNLSLVEPDLTNELVLIVEDQIPKNSPAFANFGKKIITALKKKKLV